MHCLLLACVYTGNVIVCVCVYVCAAIYYYIYNTYVCARRYTLLGCWLLALTLHLTGLYLIHIKVAHTYCDDAPNEFAVAFAARLLAALMIIVNHCCCSTHPFLF